MKIIQKVKQIQSPKKIFQRWLDEALGDDLGEDIQPGLAGKLDKWLDLHTLCDVLPYQYYDEEAGLYGMENAKGFLLKAEPMSGAGLHDDGPLSDLLQEVLPEGCIISVRNWASPKIGPDIDRFLRTREGSGAILEKMAEVRANIIGKGAHQSLLKSHDYIYRNYCLYIDVVFPNELELSTEQIGDYKNHITQAFENIHVKPVEVLPDEFLQIIHELLCPADAIYPEPIRWDPLVPLNQQILRAPMRHRVSPKKVAFNDEGWEIHTFYVEQFPREPIFLPEMIQYLGDVFDDKAKFPCPFSLNFSVEIIPQAWVESVISVRADRAKTRAKQLSGKSDKAIKESIEWREIVELTEQSQKVVDGAFSIVVHCRAAEAKKVYARIQKIFKRQGKVTHVKPNYFLQLPMLLASLPLIQSKQLFQVLRKIGRTQRMWAENAANLFPMMGEIKGHYSKQFMLGQRLGQILFWDNYLSNTNFNACIAGDSGAGKSVMVNEIINSLLATDGVVNVIDLGQSYRKQCVVLNGAYVSLKESVFSINPFTNVNFEDSQEVESFKDFMSTFVGCLAFPDGIQNDFHKCAIEQAVSYVVWSKKSEGELQDIIDYLASQEELESNQVAKLLLKFAKVNPKTGLAGDYGEYFNGPANIDVSNRFVVYELEGVSEVIKPAILQILMYMVTIKMYLGDRKRKVTLVIDEAYDTLESKAGVKIATNVARRARKYKGALIAASQHVDDYTKKEAAKAIFEQSHWLLMMKQKRDNLTKLFEEKTIPFSEYQQKLMYSVRSIKGDFSEVLIAGSDGESALGRLILDPYSLAMYSTQPEDYEFISTRLEQGYEMEQAIWDLACEHYGLAIEEACDD